MRPRKPSSPKEQALRLLARREHSAKELALKLKRKSRESVVSDTLGADELSPELEALMDTPRAPQPINTDALISELQADQYQSDERFARALVRRRASDGYGPVRIRAELKTHGIAGPVIEQAFNEAEVDWSEQLDRQVQRHLKLVQGSRQEQLKLAAKLQQRGFAGDQIRGAMRRAAAGSDDSDGFDD
ncbi:regulatory protein RecX [Ahniella affigens]|nr:regulatory protein RecX [Ahniella affigens]